jgi:hypothetical protein
VPGRVEHARLGEDPQGDLVDAEAAAIPRRGFRRTVPMLAEQSLDLPLERYGELEQQVPSA